MASTIRIKNYDKSTNKDTEYKEVDERTPLPVVISGGVIGGTDGEIPVFDGNVNIETVGGEPVSGSLTVRLTADQVAALKNPDVQQVGGTLTIGNQKLDVILLNEKITVEGAVSLTNTQLNVNLTNPSVPVTDNGGSLTVDGTIMVGNTSLPVTFSNTSIVVSDGGEALNVKGSVNLTNASIPITDNGGSLTVDGTVNVGNPVTSVAVNNFPAPVTSVAVNNQPTTYPVTDNGGSLTVDGAVSVTNTVPVLISNPALYVNIEPGSQPIYAKISDDGGSITVDGGVQVTNSSIAVTQSGTWTVTSVPSGTQSVTMNAPTLTTTSTTLSAFRNAGVLATPVAVKGAPGRVHKYHFGNPNSAVIFVHIYNALAANVTVGTTNPVMTYMVAAGGALDGYWPNSENYTVGVSVAVTTTATGTTAPASGALVNIGYI